MGYAATGWLGLGTAHAAPSPNLVAQTRIQAQRGPQAESQARCSESITLVFVIAADAEAGELISPIDHRRRERQNHTRGASHTPAAARAVARTAHGAARTTARPLRPRKTPAAELRGGRAAPRPPRRGTACQEGAPPRAAAATATQRPRRAESARRAIPENERGPPAARGSGRARERAARPTPTQAHPRDPHHVAP